MASSSQPLLVEDLYEYFAPMVRAEALSILDELTEFYKQVKPKQETEPEAPGHPSADSPNAEDDLLSCYTDFALEIKVIEEWEYAD
jgi:hypothetical protein